MLELPTTVFALTIYCTAYSVAIEFHKEYHREWMQFLFYFILSMQSIKVPSVGAFGVI